MNHKYIVHRVPQTITLEGTTVLASVYTWACSCGEGWETMFYTEAGAQLDADTHLHTASHSID